MSSDGVVNLSLDEIEESIKRAHAEKEQLYTRIVFLEGYIAAMTELKTKFLEMAK